MTPTSLTTGIHVDDEIQRVLHENRVDLLEHLHAAGFDVRLGPPTYADESPSGAKGALMIVLASAAAAPLVAEAIVRVVRGLSDRPVIVQEQVLVPVSDANGHPVKDSHDRPILYWTQHHRVIAPPAGSQAGNTTQLTLEPTRLSITLGSTTAHDR